MFLLILLLQGCAGRSSCHFDYATVGGGPGSVQGIEGTVRDEKGRARSMVNVKLYSLDSRAAAGKTAKTQLISETVTDKQGYYVFANPTPGNYRITYERKWFKGAVKNVTVEEQTKNYVVDAGIQSLLWFNTYGGSADDNSYNTMVTDVMSTADGRLLVVGYSESNDGDVSGNHGDRDCWLAKCTYTGELEWSMCYGGSESEGGNVIFPTSDGGVLVIATTDSQDGDIVGSGKKDRDQNYIKPWTFADENNFDIWIFKIDAGGSIIWKKCYGGSSIDEIYDAVANGDGTYTLAGYSASFDQDLAGVGNHSWYGNTYGYEDVFLMTIDEDGNVLNKKCYGGTSTDRAQAILKVDGGYIIGGLTQSGDGDLGAGPENILHYDWWYFKVDNNLNMVWQKTYSGINAGNTNYNNRLYSICASQQQDGYILTGEIGHDTGMSKSTVGVVNIDLNGNIVWEKQFGSPNSFNAGNIIRQCDGGYAIGGYVSAAHLPEIPYYYGQTDAWLCKINDAGDVLWSKSYGGSAYDVITNILPMPDGGFFITGFTSSTNNDVQDLDKGGFDIFVIRTDEFGEYDIWP